MQVSYKDKVIEKITQLSKEQVSKILIFNSEILIVISVPHEFLIIQAPLF